MHLSACLYGVRVRETHVLSPKREGVVMGTGLFELRHVARVLWDGDVMEQPVDPGHIEPCPETP